MTEIRRLDARSVDDMLPALAGLLVHAVEQGASLGFLSPLASQASAAYWESVRDAVAGGSRVLLVALRGGALLGTVQLDLCGKPNGINRAEVQKLIVHSDARRAGVASMLMKEAEKQAQLLSRGLLHLDTEAGSAAEGFYRSCGYVRVGELPDFAASPQGQWRPTAIYYKTLFAPRPIGQGAAV
jgi:ribosomal protein S18 acetylase RimI-like enzyme